MTTSSPSFSRSASAARLNASDELEQMLTSSAVRPYIRPVNSLAASSLAKWPSRQSDAAPLVAVVGRQRLAHGQRGDPLGGRVQVMHPLQAREVPSTRGPPSIRPPSGCGRRPLIHQASDAWHPSGARCPRSVCDILKLANSRDSTRFLPAETRQRRQATTLPGVSGPPFFVRIPRQIDGFPTLHGEIHSWGTSRCACMLPQRRGLPARPGLVGVRLPGEWLRLGRSGDGAAGGRAPRAGPQARSGDPGCRPEGGLREARPEGRPETVAKA